MLDRLFMPALTFTLLVAACAAFAVDLQSGADEPQQVVRLERVVVTAQREPAATPVAQAGHALPQATLR